MIDKRIPEHLSYSSISLFAECPERWYNRYILKHPEDPSKELLIGSAFHSCMEDNFNHKLKYGVDISRSMVKDVFEHRFKEATAEQGFSDKDVEDHLPTAWLLVEQYHREIASTLIPKEVEKKFEIPLPGQHIKKLIGFIDLIIEDGTFIDYKTTFLPWPDAKVTQSLQPTVYGLLSGAKNLDFEYHMILKAEFARKEKFGDGIVIKKTVRRQKDFDWLMVMITKMINILESDNFYDYVIPSPSPACLKCPYRKPCGYRTR